MTEFLEFPAATEAWVDWLAARIDGELERAGGALAALKDGTPRATDQVLALWNDSDIALGNADSLAGTLSQVHPDEAARTLAEDRAQQISRIRTDRGLDRDLYEVVAATTPQGLGDADARRLRERVLRDFRRSGVDRDDETRERLRAIRERLTVLDQDFSRTIRDDVRTVRLRPDQLAGLPQDYIDGHPVEPDGRVAITTDYPDSIPFRMFAHDAAARRELTVAMLDRGWPENDAVVAELLALRAELATLLGYDGWPDYDAEIKMIGDGPAIQSFIDQIVVTTDEAARRDLGVLLTRARQDDPAITGLTRADAVYYEELVRREQFDVDAQQVRRYFDFERVRAGLLDVTGRLFGLEYRPRPDVPAWHTDVTVHDVVQDGAVIGRIYLDLHPRGGKFKHAAQFDLVGGIAGRQLPEGALVCNFPRGLMEHSHVVTLFHEFGHLVHHIIAGRQQFHRFTGVATEWDFVEAPSQMLEEWAWDAEVLRSFAVDDAGEPIPTDLVDRMVAGNQFGQGMSVRTQIFYAAVSYLLHRDRPADLTGAVRDLHVKYELLDYLEGTHFHAAFGHLSGYSSAYYTYMWSLVIAKDLFAAFDRSNLFEPEIARRYRDEVLAPGGRRDAADLVAAFLGRPYSFAAFERWLNEVPVGRT